MTNEEIVASAFAEILKPWLERIKQLETKSIEQGAELRLLKELTLRDEKHTSLLFPGGKQCQETFLFLTA
jgi:hypothetical protein